MPTQWRKSLCYTYAQIRFSGSGQAKLVNGPLVKKVILVKTSEGFPSPVLIINNPGVCVHQIRVGKHKLFLSFSMPSIFDHNIWNILGPQTLGSDPQLLNRSHAPIFFGSTSRIDIFLVMHYALFFLGTSKY